MEVRAVKPNQAGRLVPGSLNGRTYLGFQGVGGFHPDRPKHGPPIRTCADYPASGDKRVATLKEAVERSGIRSGGTVSTHHHLRNGDRLAIPLFQALEELGLRDLRWMPSAVFPCHEALIPFLESGVIRGIEGSLNGPLGEYASFGGMRETAVLRSHGGRYRAIQDGDVRVDLAVLAAPACDPFGNATGLHGPNACGSLGFAMADAQYADHVIAVTDHLMPFPCPQTQILGNYVDQVVVVDSIGDAAQILSGTTRLTRSPDRLLISELAAAFVEAAGLMRDGFSFQAGAGGVSLAFTAYLRDRMRARGVRAGFIRGGSTRVITEMLREGLTDAILDGQTFDAEAVRSLREDPRHVATSPFISYNYHGKGNVASMLDVAVLGATEVDLGFNANVATHSDGLMLHGLGGWPDALFAKCTILAIPSFRNRIPVIKDRVLTLCGPGELVDVVVTERGIAIHPRREDLLDRVRGSGLPLRTLEELKHEAEGICGVPEPPRLRDRVIGVVEWVDGTLLDSIREVEPEVTL